MAAFLSRAEEQESAGAPSDKSLGARTLKPQSVLARLAKATPSIKYAHFLSARDSSIFF
jgi:hypothetical protein